MKSLERYPLPVTTEKEACALEGVGSFTARRMLRGLQAMAAPTAGNSSGTAAGSAVRTNRTDEENIEPTTSSSARGGGRKSKTTGGSAAAAAAGGCASSTNTTSMLRMNLRPGGSAHSRGNGGGATNTAGEPLSLASNFAAMRGGVDGEGEGEGARTPDVTPKRPTSRPRREEVGDDTRNTFSSKAPRFFSGQWEARLIVDNREHGFMSMQVSTVRRDRSMPGGNNPNERDIHNGCVQRFANMKL